ncbi:MAG TPA: galactokinase family protein [Chitinophagaceae bacterium]|nr:galactokinase family protein [Chitinophagaceae bacterium]
MNDLFSTEEKIISATAPGRIDVMGGIADYSGSLLLQMPIKQTTTVSIQKRNDGVFHFRTQITKKNTSDFIIHLSAIKNNSLIEAGKVIKSVVGGDWAVYVLGCFLVLQKENKIDLTGANVFIESNVPWGKGVSSSAALEVATMNALNQLYQLSLGKEELAVFAQMAENRVAGAPCGLMDQLSSHLGQKNKLLPLICQPHQVDKAISIPRGINFNGIDSGVRHAVSGASYSDVRAAAFMSYTMIALNEGATVEELDQARTSGDWNKLPFKGFLANIPVPVFEEKYISLLPREISGKDFLTQYKLSIDTVTNIDEDKIYKPLVCSSHPVYENARVNEFKTLLKSFKKQDEKQASLIQMGNLMMQSHESYSKVGLGNEYTDKIVEMIRDAGPARGVFGARVSGGGNGGTVCILSYGKEGKNTVKEIYRKYKQIKKQKLFFFSGSSHGAYSLNQYI